MTDDFPAYQKRTFISKLNPESPPFLPSSYYQHIQEVSQPKISSENHLHIEPITNDHYNNQNYHLATIHPIEPSEHVSIQRHYIQETIPDNQHSIVSSHIEPVNISYDDQEEKITHVNEKPDEIKVQRELDEDSPNITDTPLNKSSSSLPDVVTETLEKESNEPDDVLGNKSLLKQVITPGEFDTRPTRNSLATVSYKLFLIDNATSTSRLIETITNESFFVGEYDILPAIDVCIQLMDRGEHAVIDSDIRHCYGEIGCEEKQIPPVSADNSYRMKVDVEFHDWKYPPDIPTLSIEQRLYWSDKKRQRGNFSYRRKDYSTALQCYKIALKFLDTIENPLLNEEENQSSILTERYIQVQNNLAQVYLLNNQYDLCLNAVDDVLKHDSTNIKALFRQGKAFFELGNYDQALQPLKLLRNNSSKDVEKEKVNEMLKICETQLAKYQKNEKEIYKRMFQSSPTTTANEKSPIPKIETKTTNNNNNNSWWTYVAMGSAVLAAAVGLAAVIKNR